MLIDSKGIGVNNGSPLSASPGKAAALLADPHFRLGQLAAKKSFGSDYLEQVQTLALVVIRPDAIYARTAHLGLAYLEEHGYRVRGTWPVQFNRAIFASAASFQTAIYTTASLQLQAAAASASASLILLVEKPMSELTEPACVQLNRTKGSSMGLKPDDEESLRRVMGGHDPILKRVHIPDEPGDVLRELSIYTDRNPERAFGTLGLPASQTLERVYDATPSGSIKEDVAIERAKEALDVHGSCPKCEWLSRALRRPDMRIEFEGSWTLLKESLAHCEAELGTWDALAIGARLFQHPRYGKQGDGVRAQFRDTFAILRDDPPAHHYPQSRSSRWTLRGSLYYGQEE